MTSIIVAALLVLTATDDSDTAGLITRLASGDFAVREAASVAIEAKGRDALAAIHTAISNAGDPEVRERAVKLLAKIESNVLTRPTLVTLDIRNQKVGEALSSLGQQYNFRIIVGDDDLQENLQRIVMTRPNRPIPLLAAINWLCVAGGLDFGDRDKDDSEFVRGGVPPSTALTLRQAGASGPESSFGPFQVKIQTIRYSLERTIYLERTNVKDDERSLDESLSVLLQVIAEPRLLLRPIGEARITEAVDDQGVSLLRPSSPDWPGRYTGRLEPFFNFELKLKPPSHKSRMIKRLRGVLPVYVAELLPEPVAIQLAGSNGKSFDGPDITLMLERAREMSTTLPPSPSWFGRSLAISTSSIDRRNQDGRRLSQSFRCYCVNSFWSTRRGISRRTIRVGSIKKGQRRQWSRSP